MASLAKSKVGSSRMKTFYAILIPALVLFVAFNTYPLITGFFYSFTDSKGYGAFNMVGLLNYADLFTDTRVLNSYLFTFKVAVVATILTNVISLMLAMALSSKIKFKSALRGLFFVPQILGALVVGYVFQFLFTWLIPAFFNTDYTILGDPTWAWIAIVVVLVWQSCAQTTIIYITGLSSVPEDVYEAGALDGAKGWNKFRYITLPLIMPSITTNMVLVMKNMLMVFDQIVAMTSGGPRSPPSPSPTSSTTTVSRAGSSASSAPTR